MSTSRQKDRSEAPAYPLSEAARYVRLPQATLRSWVGGREYPARDGRRRFEPLIRPADRDRLILSFNNLVEAHVLRALRTEHGVSIQAVRTALACAEQEFKIERLLLSKELRASAGELFLVQYGQLVNLSRSGQLAMKRLLEAYLKRIEWKTDFPVRLYPFMAAEVSDARPIAIDPAVEFGRPILARRSIPTSVIVERIDAGEKVADVAEDYELTEEEVEEAVLYERAA